MIYLPFLFDNGRGDDGPTGGSIAGVEQTQTGDRIRGVQKDIVQKDEDIVFKRYSFILREQCAAAYPTRKVLLVVK
jgi:hypothetical protein